MAEATPVPRLPAEVKRIVYVKQLPNKVTGDDLYELFGRFGSIRQIRMGTTPATRGKAYVVYDEVQEAKRCVDSLTGYNYQGRYLVASFFTGRQIHTNAANGETFDHEEKRREIAAMKLKFGVRGSDT